MRKHAITILTICAALYGVVNSEKDVKDSRVIVVGGGVAGLKAISELKRENFKHIVLLEAETKLCGRINSVYDSPGGGHSIELGAQWVSGAGLFEPMLSPSRAAEFNAIYKSDSGKLKLSDQLFDLFRDAVKSENVYENSTFRESTLPMDILVSQL